MILTCIDGGGIRGYYSLLLLRQLMMTIRKLEVDSDYSDGSGVEAPAVSSFSPLDQPPNVCHSPTDSNRQNNHRVFLPCHYFDYIAGTSTGGLVFNQ
jgi:patatin-like phospholipase/acyl hydrolase